MSAKFMTLNPRLIKSVTVPLIARSKKFDKAPPMISAAPMCREKYFHAKKIKTARAAATTIMFICPGRLAPKGSAEFSEAVKFCLTKRLLIWSANIIPKIIIIDNRLSIILFPMRHAILRLGNCRKALCGNILPAALANAIGPRRDPAQSAFNFLKLLAHIPLLGEIALVEFDL